MPSLLRSLEPSEVTRPMRTAADPLLITFPTGWAPSGLFCALLVELLSTNAPLEWDITSLFFSSDIKVLNENAIELSVAGVQGTIMLINTEKWYEVFPSQFFPSKQLSLVWKQIDTCLKQACSTFSYRITHRFAFHCNCGELPEHPEVVSESHKEVECSKDPGTVGPLSAKQSPWFEELRVYNQKHEVEAIQQLHDPLKQKEEEVRGREREVDKREEKVREREKEVDEREEEVKGKERALRKAEEEVRGKKTEVDKREEELRRKEKEAVDREERSLQEREEMRRQLLLAQVEKEDLTRQIHHFRAMMEIESSPDPAVSPPLFNYLRGAEVVAKRRFHITTQAQTFEWRENGFKLLVPEGCVSTDADYVTLDVGVSLWGQFDLPKDSHLVSAIYWLQCSAKLEMPITLEVQHCASLTDPSHCARLSFVVTESDENELPYKFCPLEGGTFTPNSSFGSITRSQFCGLGITIKHLFGRSETIYCGHQFYKCSPNDWTVHFVVVKNLPPHLNIVKQEYSTGFMMESNQFTFAFSEDSLSVKIPMEGELLENGWKVIPIHPLRVMKSQVDAFTHGVAVPKFKLKAVWTSSERSPVLLAHQLMLKGAKGEVYITLYISDLEVPSGDQSARVVANPVVILKTDDFRDVYKAVYAAKAKWKPLGVELLLKPCDIEGISMKKPGDPEECLSEVIRLWLQRCSRNPTWSKLVVALREPTVDLEEVADTIVRKHLDGVDPVTVADTSWTPQHKSRKQDRLTRLPPPKSASDSGSCVGLFILLFFLVTVLCCMVKL